MSKDIWHNKKEKPTKKLHCTRLIITKWGSVYSEKDIDNGAFIETDWAYLDDLLALETELERTRKALDVARGALKEQQRWFGVIRISLISHLNNQYGTLFKSYDADPTVVNIKRANDILNRALEQITALEQKDVK